MVDIHEGPPPVSSAEDPGCDAVRGWLPGRLSTAAWRRYAYTEL